MTRLRVTSATVDAPLRESPKRPTGFPDPLGPQRSGTLEIHLDVTHSSVGILKVLSVLHSRRVAIHHLQYAQHHDHTAAVTVQYSPGPTVLETIRRSVAHDDD